MRLNVFAVSLNPLSNQHLTADEKRQRMKKDNAFYVVRVEDDHGCSRASCSRPKYELGDFKTTESIILPPSFRHLPRICIR